MGLWPSVAPTGYLNSKNVDQKGQIFLDPQRAPIIKEAFTKIAHGGWSGRKIYRWLKEIKFISRNGKPLTLSNIYTILNNHFYHGTFEYPGGSGRWYQGKHVPIITKELFNEAQEQLQLQRKVRNGGNKEFAFTRLMFCGRCGSGVTAQDKYKKLKDGTVARYVYYGCTRAKNINCKEQYIEEKILITQLLGLMDKIDLDKSGVRHSLEAKIEQHKKFHSNILGKSEEEYSAKDIDIRNYAKYILREGNIIERRGLIAFMKTRITVIGKAITLVNGS
jgi:hypothetical protein